MTERKREPGLLTAKRRITAEALRARIEQEYPDPVYRLAKGGESQQLKLTDVYSANQLLAPPYSVAVMSRLEDLDPYLAGCIDAIATNVASGEMKLRWTGDGDGPAAQRETLETFFFGMTAEKNPCPLKEEIKACAIDYLTYGNWNLEIIEAGNKPARLMHAPAELIRVRADETGYVMIKNGKEAYFSIYGDPGRNKALHQILRAINKHPGHRVYGKPAILPLLSTVLMNASRDEKNLDWFDQGVLADILVLLEEAADDTVCKRIIADYQNTSDGEQSMFILHGVGKGVIKEIKRELEGKSFDSMEDNNRQRIFTALRVPPAKVAVFEDANRANTITQDETFRNEVTVPMQEMFTDRFNHAIANMFKLKDWKIEIKSRALKDRKEEAEVNNIYLDKAALSVNEVRGILGLPKVEGGDRRVMNTPLGLVDLATWEIAVAADMPEERAAAVRLVTRLMALRKELKGNGNGAVPTHS